jgi:hypothetical protein
VGFVVEQALLHKPQAEISNVSSPLEAPMTKPPGARMGAGDAEDSSREGLFVSVRHVSPEFVSPEFRTPVGDYIDAG